LRRRRRRRRKVYSKLTQRTRRTPSATALPRCRRLVPPCYVPEGDSPGRREERKREGGVKEEERGGYFASGAADLLSEIRGETMFLLTYSNQKI